jgi:hypothetical protein
MPADVPTDRATDLQFAIERLAQVVEIEGLRSITGLGIADAGLASSMQARSFATIMFTVVTMSRKNSR